MGEAQPGSRQHPPQGVEKRRVSFQWGCGTTVLRTGCPGDISCDAGPVSECHKQLSIAQLMGEGIPAGAAEPHQPPAPAPPLALGLAPLS